MNRLKRQWFPRALLPALAVVCVLSLAHSAKAVNAEVRDDAGFFSPAAREYANKEIADIQRTHHKDMMVETFPTLPQEYQGELERVKGDEAEKTALMRRVARERAQALGENGVYVFICKSPGHIEVVEGNATGQKAFTPANRDVLAKNMLAAFKEKDFDRALRGGVDYVRKTMDANLGGGTASRGGVTTPPPMESGTRSMPSTPSTPSTPAAGDSGGFKMHPLLWIGIAVVGLILLAKMFGGSRPNQAAGYGPGAGVAGPGVANPGPHYNNPGPGYNPNVGPGYNPNMGGQQQSQGGGFLRNAAGGVVGGVAGGYLYDKLAHHGQGGSAGASPAPNAPAPEERDTSYTSSGGDFDSGSSSAPSGPEGNFGSGDSGGGGDFGGGGGDFGGGGGGDSGSSGGDF